MKIDEDAVFTDEEIAEFHKKLEEYDRNLPKEVEEYTVIWDDLTLEEKKNTLKLIFNENRNIAILENDCFKPDSSMTLIEEMRGNGDFKDRDGDDED